MRPWLIIVLSLVVGGLMGWFWPKIERIPLILAGSTRVIGTHFPDLPLVGGRFDRLAATRGKVVFINIWAEW